jgi:2-dehydro-3-deoxygluconokinase
VVDRIGSGDAFAAGLIHGQASGLELRAQLEFALAAAALKHAIPGDFNLSTVGDVEALIRDGAGGVRR